ncbi:MULTISPECIES: tetratricopeptide repeat protein [unclassified Roseofilum]|uniref:tetratricopeptide repeat protein n=1 Tax=unclassified Roseofilum TaxID=2620099 RepID=UPI001B279E6B|nr:MULTISPECIES: tetratricopeptide repeat protein [unclassified Roseofilum]MBP0008118.1 tetratricopeptide repeat protein [Roseofilum sp. Belize Diploria]MBP0032645.1 tetratricopeptide repeat protein [Roseofilum sp. Belize BBD 4]
MVNSYFLPIYARDLWFADKRVTTMNRLCFAFWLTVLVTTESVAIAPKPNPESILTQNCCLVLAQDLVEKGDRLRGQQTLTAQLPAIAQWEELRYRWHRAGNSEQEAAALIKLGLIYQYWGATTPARERYRDALALAQQLGDRRSPARGERLQEAFILGQLGRLHHTDADRWQKEWQFASDRGFTSVTSRHSETLNQHRARDSDQATQFFHQALAIYEAFNQSPQTATFASRQGEAQLLNWLAESKTDTSERYELFQQALTIYEEIGDRQGEAVVLSNLTQLCLFEWFDEQAGLDVFDRSRAIYQDIGALSSEDSHWAKQQDVRLLNIMVRYWWEENQARALEFHQQALSLAREIDDFDGEALTLEILGDRYLASDNLQQGLVFYQQALAIYENLGNGVKQGEMLNHLGNISSDLGETAKALEYYSQELKTLKETSQFYTQLGDPNKALDFQYRQPIVFGKLGQIYDRLEEPAAALEQYNKAREVYQAVNDLQGEATFLLAIAIAFGDRQQQDKMLTFLNQAVQIYQQAGDREGEAQILDKIATLHLHRFGEWEQGLEALDRMLNLYRNLGDRAGEARTLYRIASLYENELEEKEKALDFYRQRVAIDRELGDSISEVFHLRTIAKIDYELGNYYPARESFKQAAQVYREKGNLEREARTLIEIGDDYIKFGEQESALEFYQQATPIYQQLGDYKKEAVNLRRMAELHYELEQVPEAILLFSQARQVYQDNRDRSGEAWTLYRTGITYMTLGDLENALVSYNQALKLYEQEPDASFREERTLDMFLRIGRIYAYSGEQKKAIEFCDRSVSSAQEFLESKQMKSAEVFREIGKLCYQIGNPQKAWEAFNIYRQQYQKIGTDEAVTGLMRVGEDYVELGDIEQALDFFVQARRIYQERNFPEGEVNTLTWIANLYFRSGDYPEAFEFYREALRLTQLINNPHKEAGVWSKLGGIYLELGEREKALASYEQALQIYRNLGNGRREGETLEDLGTVYEQLKEREKALEFYEDSLTLFDERGLRWKLGASLRKIGQLHFELGNLEPALRFFNQSLIVADRRYDFLYVELGKVHAQLGNLEQAWDAFNTALKLDPVPETEADILLGMARIERQRGNLSMALNRIEAAIALIEEVRARKNSPEERQTFFAAKQLYYEFYINLLMELHQQNPTKDYDAQALNINERSRARSLLELLAEANTDIRKGVDPDLVLQERLLQQQLDALERREVALYQEEFTQEQVVNLKQERQYLLNQYKALQRKIREVSPSYAALTQPEPVTLEEIQQNILDRDTLVLQYALGEERSFLWAITQESLTSYILPSRQEIEQKARQFRSDIIHPLSRRQPQKAIASGEALNSLILQPLREHSDKKRLAIVADGALHYIPFSALPNPHARENNLSSLVEAYELVHLPSLSTLAILRQDFSQRQSAPQALAIIADPVFSRDDERLENHPSSSTSNSVSLLPRATTDIGVQLQRLPGTRQEAEAIASLIPESQRIQAFDFEANYAFATHTPLNQYRTVHFATHGILNSVNPELSGLVLSLIDEQGNPSNGFLRLHDIYNLDLSADLVVLSACQTGLGKEIQGEGLIGLTRGFMYAGTPRVLVSLWNVDDAATAEMMTRFYRLMWQEQLSPTKALQEAQLEMQTETQWKAPFYWAGFTLQGKWEEIN